MHQNYRIPPPEGRKEQTLVSITWELSKQTKIKIEFFAKLLICKSGVARDDNNVGNRCHLPSAVSF